MNELLQLLQMPIPSIAGILALWIVAERMGLPISSLFSKLLRLNGNNTKVPDWAENLIHQVNHTQTEVLERIARGIEQLERRSELHCKKLDKLIMHNDEVKEYGMKMRKD